MFGFPSDARTLQQVPAVVQVSVMAPVEEGSLGE